MTDLHGYIEQNRVRSSPTVLPRVTGHALLSVVCYGDDVTNATAPHVMSYFLLSISSRTKVKVQRSLMLTSDR